MKKLLVVLALAMAFTLTAVAQDTGSSQTSTQESTKTSKSKKAKAEGGAMKEASLKGCLAAGTEPNTWTLTHGKKTYTVSGVDLSQHVGHEVKLTGEHEKGGKFKATNVEHISDTCTASAAAGGKTKKEKKEGATPPGF